MDSKARTAGSRGEKIVELRAPSGRIYDMEIWASPETEDRLRIFATVVGQASNDEWVDVSTDFFVERPAVS